MIENNQMCYLYKAGAFPTNRLYKRIVPDNNQQTVLDKWNTSYKDEAGCLPKAQWLKRFSTWSYKTGYFLESTTGEEEALTC